MDNKVYYGEYSLEYWIELIMKGNIVLPEYQRSFAWSDDKRKALIESLKNNEFIPPIIIGSFKIDKIRQNILIDGQQRLTSILLSYLGYFPDKEKYKKVMRRKKNIDENDDNYDSQDDEGVDIVNWSLNNLIKINDRNLTKKELKTRLEKNEYFKEIKENAINDNDTILRERYIGFSYLVPSDDDPHSQQKFYSSIFRNINFQGVNLLPEESRRALYFLDNEKQSLFEPDFIKEMKGDYSIDFVRYLSIISQYIRHGETVNHLCKGFSGIRRLEEFYSKYIKTIVGDEESSEFPSYNTLFKDGHIKILNELGNIIVETGLSAKSFESIIDCDMYYFGLIYWFVFKSKQIDIKKWNELENNLEKLITKYKYPYIDNKGEPTPIHNESRKTNRHPKSPSLVGFIRQRVKDSIECYREVMEYGNEA